MLSDKAEEMLKTVWTETIGHKKYQCDVSMLKDSDCLKELVRSGDIRLNDQHLSLTIKGRMKAQEYMSRYDTAERLCCEAGDVKERTAHENRCALNNMLHEGLDYNICPLPGHSRTCLQRKAVREGKCCMGIREEQKRLIIPLTELKNNKKASVSFLQTDNRMALKKMIAIGVLPKTRIHLIQKFPSYVIQVGKSQFAIDRELAGNIFVRLE